MASGDREADEYELALHRKSAMRGFLLGGAIIAIGAVGFFVSFYSVGLVILGGILIGGAITHRTKAAQLEQALRFGAYAPPAFTGGAAAELGRGSKVAVTWTDGRVYEGFILQTREGYYLVQFDGRQEWAPAQAVAPAIRT
jgi:hypothetical protein